MMFSYDNSFASCFVCSSSDQLHISAGEGKASQIENCFFPDLHVRKTLSAECRVSVADFSSGAVPNPAARR